MPVQTRAEELVNVITHGVGLALSLAAMAVLVTLAVSSGSVWHVVSFSIFGASLVLLYLASTCYHAWRPGTLGKRWLRVLDHSAIFALIAGTYTPILLVCLRGAWGWSLLGVLWGLTIAGTIFKAMAVERFELIGTAIYLAMGWILIVAIQPAIERIPPGAWQWIIAGGAAYTVGVAFFLWEKLPFNHGLWHLFVLAGSVCHFIAIVGYILP